MNLVAEIRKTEGLKAKLKREFDNELAALNTALAAFRKHNTACERCAGKGKYFHRACAEDDGYEKTCDDCKGTGKLRKGAE